MNQEQVDLLNVVIKTVDDLTVMARDIATNLVQLIEIVQDIEKRLAALESASEPWW